ncbi:MAG: fuconate dehydratase, partial [Gammaproteobacteria bacterium]
QHISFFDAAAVASSSAGRFIEHAGHLHEHFIDPIRIEQGRYRAPTLPGYSVQMRAASVEAHRFPDGTAWQ